MDRYTMVPLSLFFVFCSGAALDMKSLMRREPQRTKRKTEALSSLPSPWDKTLNLDPTFLDGCSHIFMDIGAGSGANVRKLFEPEKYPDLPFLAELDAAFGLPKNRTRRSTETGICAFGFEANPRHSSVLQDIEKAYRKKGWKVKFFSPLAGGDSSGLVRINMNEEHSGWGSFLFGYGGGVQDVDVPQTSLADFVQAVSAYSKPGFKLMRMDIGSLDYKVLHQFLEYRLLCQDFLNKLTVKWHETSLHLADVPNALKLRYQVEYPAPEACGPHVKPTEVSTLDDDSNENGDIPLP